MAALSPFGMDNAVMRGKLSHDHLEQVLAPWRSSPRVKALPNRLMTVMELYAGFPLDIAVTGGTPAANARLVKVLCEQGEGKGELREGEGVEEPRKGEMQEGVEWETGWQVAEEDQVEKQGKKNESMDVEEGDREEEEEEEEGESGTEEVESEDRDSDEDKKQRSILAGVHPEFSTMYLHSHDPNVRLWILPDIYAPSPISHSRGDAEIQLVSNLDRYDMLVVLTSDKNQEDHLMLTIELQERNKPLCLVRAEPGWDLAPERSRGACKTCAWERMSKRYMELKQRRGEDRVGNAEEGKSTKLSVPCYFNDFGFGSKLIDLGEIGAVMMATLHELKKRAFCEFMMEVTRELRVPKLLRSNMTVVSDALKTEKMRQEDLNQISELCQSGGLTCQPAKLIPVLTALDHFQLDMGVLGEAGCGTSSLVNSLRGLKSQDVWAAPTGPTTTTEKAIAYPHPKFPNMRLWDFPGIRGSDEEGARDEPESSHSLPLHPLCDIYILVLPHVLKLRYTKLLEHISNLGLHYFLVLTKRDQLGNEAIRETRERWVEALGSKGLSQDVFVVSALHLERFDFPKLRQALRHSVPIRRREACALYLAKKLEESGENTDACIVM